jgi:hypothetical protein
MTRAISPSGEPALCIGQWVFDPARRLLVGPVGWRALRPRAAAALRVLARAAPAAVDLEALRRGAWGRAQVVDEATVTAIGRLRAAFATTRRRRASSSAAAGLIDSCGRARRTVGGSRPAVQSASRFDETRTQTTTVGRIGQRSRVPLTSTVRRAKPMAAS